MTYHYTALRGEAASTAADLCLVACPNCNAQLMFRRAADPHIDACGFESYRMQCDGCRSQLVGIIDPADDMLLLSDAAA